MTEVKNKSNEIRKPRPHHPLVEDLEAVFLGCWRTYRLQPQPLRFWETVNEWMVVASLCLLIGIISDFIVRF